MADLPWGTSQSKKERKKKRRVRREEYRGKKNITVKKSIQGERSTEIPHCRVADGRFDVVYGQKKQTNTQTNKQKQTKKQKQKERKKNA